MRVVLDTNVLVSALLKANSNPDRILRLWRNGRIEVLVSSAVLEEIRRVLEYPRIRDRVPKAEGDRFMDLLESLAIVVNPEQVISVVLDDPDDNKFVSLALAGEAQYIISGDKHLLDIGHVERISIVTPSVFLSQWRSQS